MTNYFVKRYYTDFVGKVQCVDYVGPYSEDQTYVLEAQSAADMRRQKPAKTQITFWEWVAIDQNTKEETAIGAHAGYRTRSFSRANRSSAIEKQR
jgi:hypothetical protein